MKTLPGSENLQIEIRLRSTVNSKSNAELQREVLAAAPELEKELRAEVEDLHGPRVEKTEITPEAAFPGAVEAFLVTVAIAFAAGVAEGFAEGAGKEFGKEAGKPIGAAAGKMVGKRIKEWIEKRWPDAEVVSVVPKE
jgi:hypothetical protein